MPVALIGELAPVNEKQNMIGKVMGMMFFGGAVATSIGGGLAYLGSWKLVYLAYGAGELILTVIAYSTFKTHQSVVSNKGFIKLYSEALSSKYLRRMLLLLFLMGYCILGSFVYVGKLIEIKTSFNVLIIGLILGFFGLGTILARRKSGTIRAKTGNFFFPLAGIIGFCAVFLLSWSNSVTIISLCLLAFGVVFIAFQSSFITISQSVLPHIRGTVMSLASFCVVVGGSIGTTINGLTIKRLDIHVVFYITAFLLLIISVLAYFFIKSIARK